MSGLVEAAAELLGVIDAALLEAAQGSEDLVGSRCHLEPADAIDKATSSNVAQVLIGPPTYTRGGVLEGHVDVAWTLTVCTRKTARVLDAWRRLDRVIDVVDQVVDVVRAQPGQLVHSDGDPLPAYVLTLDPTTV